MEGRGSPTLTRICKSSINCMVRLWQQFFWDTDGLLMADYLHPGKTITGQYYAEPTFELLDVIKQTQWRKLSLRSLTFSRQCASAQVIRCSASSARLWICWTKPSCLQSRLGSQWSFPKRNLKYRLRGTWFIDSESLKIAIEAWSESQTRKYYF